MMRERITLKAQVQAVMPPRLIRRVAINLAVLIATGLLMGFIAPFGTDRAPALQRYLYWMGSMFGGGLVGLIGDHLLSRRLHRPWLRVVIGSIVLTPAVAVVVHYCAHAIMGNRFDWEGFIRLSPTVWPVLLAVLAVHTLIWHRPKPQVETRTLIAPPLPEAEAVFRQRLSAKRRHAPLLAVEAHDHYLKVHTEAGEEMITLRLTDALNELAMAHGYRVHRSWWVADSAIDSARWHRTTGEITLKNGLTLPVSRSYRPLLKEAGWL